MTKAKSKFHPRNYHKGNYDLHGLAESHPPLKEYIIIKYERETIDFFEAKAVLELNKAILIKDYELTAWDLSDEFLVPSVPGRAEYLHHVADLLGSFNNNKYPRGDKINCLDIGTGANCIYPIIGRKCYSWSFVGTESNTKAIASAERIIAINKLLNNRVVLRKQKNPKTILKGIIAADEYFDLSICNPPFYASAKEAQLANQQKNKALKNSKAKAVPRTKARNFRGQDNELWYPGGELAFVTKLIQESQGHATNCFLFTSLVSKKINLPKLEQQIKKVNATYHTVLEMQHGNKTSRILAWSFLSPKQIKVWVKTRWQ